VACSNEGNVVPDADPIADVDVRVEIEKTMRVDEYIGSDAQTLRDRTRSGELDAPRMSECAPICNPANR